MAASRNIEATSSTGGVWMACPMHFPTLVIAPLLTFSFNMAMVFFLGPNAVPAKCGTSAAAPAAPGAAQVRSLTWTLPHQTVRGCNDEPAGFLMPHLSFSE